MPNDTSAHAQRLLDQHYRAMSPAEKYSMVRESWALARTVQLAALRHSHPDASSDELEDLVAERRLGRELFARAARARAVAQGL